MPGPLVSVVMPVCNAERFLGQAIESIRNQTLGDFEFIITDYGSTDPSMEIAARHAGEDDRLKIVRIGRSVLPEARNAGCEVARGRYIAVMDGDDVAMPTRLQREVQFLEKHPEIAMVGAATEWIDDEGKFLRCHSYPLQNGEIRVDLQVHCPFCHPTVLMRKDAFQSLGGYRANFALAHDYDLFLRASERFELANLKEAVLWYRIHPRQVSMDRRAQQTSCILAAQASAAARGAGRPDPIKAGDDIDAAFLSKLGITEAQRQSRFALELRRSIHWMCLTGNHSEARASLQEFLKCGWTQVERWQTAELRIILARLYRQEGKCWRSLVALFRAVLCRPLVMARPLKPILVNTGLVAKASTRSQ